MTRYNYEHLTTPHYLRQKANLRERYQTDPDYRERCKQYTRQRYQQIKDDPERYAKFRQQQNEYGRNLREYKRAQKPRLTRQQRLETIKANMRERYHNDPEYRERCKQYATQRYKQIKDDPERYAQLRIARKRYYLKSKYGITIP